MRTTIVPKNDLEWKTLRLACITSTEISALFGLSPYMTEFELWHQKKNQEIINLNIGERGTWGTRLQDSIAHGIAEDQGWNVRRMNEFILDDDAFIGSSYDFGIGDDGILEIKNVDSLVFKEGWIVDGNNLEAPPHLEMQVQHQMLVSGRKYAYIGALVGGNRVELIKREPDLKIFEMIKTKAMDFMYSVVEDKEPKPDFSRDAEFIARLYGTSAAGKLLDAKNNVMITAYANEYKAISEQIKFLEGRKKEQKAHLLMAIGDAEKTLGDGFSISAKTVEPTIVESYERGGFRDFRINWSKK